jgi:hypothetical protein
MKRLIFVFTVVVLLANFGLAANILYLAHVASPSHGLWNNAFVQGLVKSGHNVTEVTAFENNFTSVNYHKIFLEEAYSFIHAEDAPEITSMVNIPVIVQFKVLYEWFCSTNCEGIQSAK